MARKYGTGSVEPRGNKWRLRYSINGVRHVETVDAASKAAAQRELRARLKAGDDGVHVKPDRGTLAEWIKTWFEIGCPGRKGQKAGTRSLERYEQLLDGHIVPALGHHQLQALKAEHIEAFYRDMKAAGKPAAGTRVHIHVVLSAALAAAVRRDRIVVNPMAKVECKPAKASQSDAIAEGLTDSELKQFVSGFRGSSIHDIVALLAATGMRRSEALALMWRDFDAARRTLTISKALEETSEHGVRFKSPKTERGKRVVPLDPATVAMLTALRERHLRLAAGVADDADVDLRLVRLPEGALIFPVLVARDGTVSFTKPRTPRDVSNAFARRAERIGFGRVRMHDLRGTCATLLMDAGQPVSRVAALLGDDPKILLDRYVKRRGSARADEELAAAMADLGAAIHGK
jgi:integrase